jgi:hypothetical protein
MILLSAMAACICLLALSSFLLSARLTGEAQSNGLSRVAFDNALWAQDRGLEQAALMAGGRPWDSRQDASDDFLDRANRIAESLSSNMLSRGIAYRFSINRSLAAQYAIESHGAYHDSDGLILKNESGTVVICGCGYDVWMGDDSAVFRLSRLGRFQAESPRPFSG